MNNKIDSGPTQVNRPAPVNQSPAASKAVSLASTPNDAPVAETPASDAVRLTGQAEALRIMQKQSRGAPAPMDQAKIAALRAALSAGEYRVNPSDIAARLDALERELAI